MKSPKKKCHFDELGSKERWCEEKSGVYTFKTVEGASKNRGHEIFKQHLISKGIDISKPNTNELFNEPVLIFKSKCETVYKNGMEIVETTTCYINPVLRAALLAEKMSCE